MGNGTEIRWQEEILTLLSLGLLVSCKQSRTLVVSSLSLPQQEQTHLACHRDIKNLLLQCMPATHIFLRISSNLGNIHMIGIIWLITVLKINAKFGFCYLVIFPCFVLRGLYSSLIFILLTDSFSSLGKEFHLSYFSFSFILIFNIDNVSIYQDS